MADPLTPEQKAKVDLASMLMIQTEDFFRDKMGENSYGEYMAALILYVAECISDPEDRKLFMTGLNNLWKGDPNATH